MCFYYWFIAFEMKKLLWMFQNLNWKETRNSEVGCREGTREDEEGDFWWGWIWKAGGSGYLGQGARGLVCNQTIKHPQPAIFSTKSGMTVGKPCQLLNADLYMEGSCGVFSPYVYLPSWDSSLDPSRSWYTTCRLCPFLPYDTSQLRKAIMDKKAQSFRTENFVVCAEGR